MGTLSKPTASAMSRRVQVRFSESDWSSLRDLAEQRGIPLTATVRSLTRTALASSRDERLDQLEVVALAGLMAAEHSLRLLEALFPNGSRRSSDVAAPARLSALDRIEEVRRDLEEARPI